MKAHECPAIQVCKKCSVEKPISAFYWAKGKASPDATCKECRKAARKQHYAKNRETTLATNRLYVERNKEKVLSDIKEWKRANPDKTRAYWAKHYANNAEAVKAKAREYAREHKAERKAYAQANRPQIIAIKRRWRENNLERAREHGRDWVSKNREYCNAQEGKRRAALLQAVPAWFDKNAVEAVYAEAARLTAETGISHEVDHAVPLRGASVSGLHWHGNLQILPMFENRSKGNRFSG